jgi:hypothetical protein
VVGRAPPCLNLYAGQAGGGESEEPGLPDSHAPYRGRGRNRARHHPAPRLTTQPTPQSVQSRVREEFSESCDWQRPPLPESVSREGGGEGEELRLPDSHAPHRGRGQNRTRHPTLRPTPQPTHQSVQSRVRFHVAYSSRNLRPSQLTDQHTTLEEQRHQLDMQHFMSSKAQIQLVRQFL